MLYSQMWLSTKLQCYKVAKSQSIKIVVETAAKTGLVVECSQFYMLSLSKLRDREEILSALHDGESLVLGHVQR